MAWLLHGCEHSGAWGFALALWATLATMWGLHASRSARAWRRAFAIVAGERARQPPEVEPTGCCPFVRSGGFHGEDCTDLGRGPCTGWGHRH